MVAYLVTGLSVSQVLEQGDDTQPEEESNTGLGVELIDRNLTGEQSLPL